MRESFARNRSRLAEDEKVSGQGQCDCVCVCVRAVCLHVSAL